MKIIAQHPSLGKKEFTPDVWDTIQAWPSSGGWQRVSAQPKETATALSESDTPPQKQKIAKQ